MGRRILYTKQEFLKAYREADSIHALAGELYIAIPTVYTYLTRYKLRPYPYIHKDKTNPLKIARAYTLDSTIKSLAKELHISQVAIRYHLRKVVAFPDKYPLSKGKMKLPDPQKIFHIRIINTLRRYPKCWDYPVRLTWHGIPRWMITDFWRYTAKFDPDFSEDGE